MKWKGVMACDVSPVAMFYFKVKLHLKVDLYVRLSLDLYDNESSNIIKYHFLIVTFIK